MVTDVDRVLRRYESLDHLATVDFDLEALVVSVEFSIGNAVGSLDVDRWSR